MKLVAFDLETWLIRPGLAAPPVVCGSFADDLGCHLLAKFEALKRLRAELIGDAHLIGQNIAFDMVCSAVEEPDLLPLIFDAYDADRIHDVGIREALMDIAKGALVERSDDEMGMRYSLELLVERHLGIDISGDKHGPDAWRLRYAELKDIPPEKWPWAARVYPMRDVAFPLEIFHRQEGGENLHDESNQCRAAFALMLMRTWGVRFNAGRVAALRARVEAEDRRSTLEFQASGILRANGKENRARLAELVTEAYAGSPPRTAASKRYPKGQVAGDRDTLAESGDPLLERYATAGKNDKYLTTYLPILEQGTAVPWNPEFNVLVATTRVSSNAQQFPQYGGVRECSEPREGMAFCSVDYGGLELRTMSQRAINTVGFSKMAEVLNAKKDPHLIAAASFQGVPYEVAQANYAAGEPLAKAYRDLGKTWNFSKGGGGGAAAMVYSAREGKNGATTKGPDGRVYVGTRFCLITKRAQQCGVAKERVGVRGKARFVCSACLKVAKQLDEGWKKAWPEQAALFAEASKLAKVSRYLTAEIPVSKVKRGKCGYTQWLNTPFQGLGAAATKRAMWLVCREMYTDRSSPLWGSRLVLNVHDELIAEVPLSRPEAGDRMAFIMRETLKEFCPDLAESVEAEPSLCMTMSKGAKTLRDASGKLLVSP